MKTNDLRKKFEENKEKYKNYDPNGQALGNNPYGLPHGREDAIVRIVPVNSAITVSGETGAENGPEGLLLGSKCIELFSPHYRPDGWVAGMFMEPIDPTLGGLHINGRKIFEKITKFVPDESLENLENLQKELSAICETLNTQVERRVHAVIKEGKLVAVIGGCHGSIFGSVKAHSKTYNDFSVLTIDAHLDLRDAYEGEKNSHASVMRNILTQIPQVKKLVSVGIRSIGRDEWNFVEENKDRVSVFYANDMIRDREKKIKDWYEICDTIVSAIPTQDVYISFDHDGFDVELCPSTGTPVPDGLKMWQAKILVDSLLFYQKRIIGYDLNEMVPNTQIDRNSAAEIFYHMYYRMVESHGVFAD